MIHPRKPLSDSLTNELYLGVTLFCVIGSRNEKRSPGAGAAYGEMSAAKPLVLSWLIMPTQVFMMFIPRILRRVLSQRMRSRIWRILSSRERPNFWRPLATSIAWHSMSLTMTETNRSLWIPELVPDDMRTSPPEAKCCALCSDR